MYIIPKRRDGATGLVPGLIPSALAALAALVAASAASAQYEDQYSKEQMLLFGTQHLDNVTSPGVLHYDFRQSGRIGGELEDQVRLTISRIDESGGKDLSTEFLSGDNNRRFSDIPGFRSNPLIMYFLQWDVEKMGAGGRVSHHYYRRLLRGALRVGARSKEVTVSHAGRQLKADLVFFEPLTGKKGDAKYKHNFSKRYEFVLTEAIPGYIYSISTLVPGEKADDDPLEHIQITFNRLEPAKAKPREEPGDDDKR